MSAPLPSLLESLKSVSNSDMPAESLPAASYGSMHGFQAYGFQAHANTAPNQALGES